MPAARRFLLLSAGGPLWTEELAMIGALPLVAAPIASNKPNRGQAALAVLLAASRDAGGLVYLLSQAAVAAKEGEPEPLLTLAEQLESYAAEMRSRGEDRQARDAERASGYVREWNEDYRAERRRRFKEEVEPLMQRVSHQCRSSAGKAQLKGDSKLALSYMKAHLATEKALKSKRLELDDAPAQEHQPYLIYPDQLSFEA
jgi:hypothetical protein